LNKEENIPNMLVILERRKEALEKELERIEKKIIEYKKK